MPAKKNSLIPGGKKFDYSRFDQRQLAAGTKVELEHTNRRDIAREIAAAHLTEDPRYYVKLTRYVETKPAKRNPVEHYEVQYSNTYYRTDHASTLEEALKKAALKGQEATIWFKGRMVDVYTPPRAARTRENPVRSYEVQQLKNWCAKKQPNPRLRRNNWWLDLLTGEAYKLTQTHEACAKLLASADWEKMFEDGTWAWISDHTVFDAVTIGTKEDLTNQTFALLQDFLMQLGVKLTEAVHIEAGQDYYSATAAEVFENSLSSLRRIYRAGLHENPTRENPRKHRVDPQALRMGTTVEIGRSGHVDAEARARANLERDPRYYDAFKGRYGEFGTFETKRRKNPDIEYSYEYFHGTVPSSETETRAWIPGELVKIGTGVDVGYGIVDRASQKDGLFVHDFGADVEVFRRAKPSETPDKVYHDFPNELMILGRALGLTYKDANGQKHEIKGKANQKLCVDDSKRILTIVGPSGVEYVMIGGAMQVDDWIRN